MEPKVGRGTPKDIQWQSKGRTKLTFPRRQRRDGEGRRGGEGGRWRGEGWEKSGEAEGRAGRAGKVEFIEDGPRQPKLLPKGAKGSQREPKAAKGTHSTAHWSQEHPKAAKGSKPNQLYMHKYIHI